MDTTTLLSNHRVADLERAERWYTALLGRGPDAVATALQAAGIAHEGVEQATSLRILRLTDPDGNRVVLTD